MSKTTAVAPTAGGEAAPDPHRVDGRTVVFGEALFDHFPDGVRVLGGAPFNVAWHLCGLGGDPVLVSAVGHDDVGADLLARMAAWGLSTAYVDRDAERATGHVRVDVEDGEPSYSIPPGQPWDRLGAPELGPGAPSLLYHGSLALRDAASRRACAALRERLGCPVFVDLNLRAPWCTDALVAECLDAADWVKLSRGELAEVRRTDDIADDELEAGARALMEAHGVATLVVTLGPEGALLIERDGPSHRAVGEPVDERAGDTVGAGDALAAILCHGIAAEWDSGIALRRAVAFAADVCRMRGATAADLTLYERHVRRWSQPKAPAVGGPGLHVLSLSVHGLVRGTDIELGRDADTGGQVSYVVDQARALARHPDVETVSLVTRRVEDRRIDDAYAVPEEALAEGARLVRLPFGPRRYLRKERLWPHLEDLLDQLARWIRQQSAPPDVIHGHYADAGYVGAHLSRLLGVPFVFTGHSLGRPKRARLLEDGIDEETLEERYRIGRRIEAEEQALESAHLVIASTRQEVREQLEGYDHYAPERMRVIPPGVDLERFSPPPPGWRLPAVAEELSRFLDDPEKPLVLAIARADERKNFAGLIEAFARTPGLRERANLAVVAGNRDDIREMPAAARRVLNEILLLIDAHDLYGCVAYPKTHRPEDVPDLYRYAAWTRGVFVNPALTEPFGLTLLEAAATGLPTVATDDGGPRDIIEACGHGVLADPLDVDALGGEILSTLRSTERWGRWSKNGVARVHERFSWSRHADDYVGAVRAVQNGIAAPTAVREPAALTRVDRLVVVDIDDTLTGDAEAVQALMQDLDDARDRAALGVATGRRLDSALEVLDELDVRVPDVLVTSSGTEIHYGPRLVPDRSWERQIRHRWDPAAAHAVFEDLDGLTPDDEEGTSQRLRFLVDGPDAPSVGACRRALRRAGLRATVLGEQGGYVDVTPVRTSPGLALRFFGFKWDLEPGRILVAGDSGSDRDLLEGHTLGVVVGNHTPDLESLRGRPRIYFARGHHAWGVREGIAHYDFLGDIRLEETHPHDP